MQIGGKSKSINHCQYFTPISIVKKALSFIPTRICGDIIDPSAGHGTFLRIAHEKWKDSKLYSVDIDPMMTKILKSRSKNLIKCFTRDSLHTKTWETPFLKNVLKKGGFDLVVGNPPFSSRFGRISTPNILSHYKIAYLNGRLKHSVPKEILFVELFLELAKHKGYIVFVLPESILSNKINEFARRFILNNARVLKIFSLPRTVFSGTSAKTSILILQKNKTNNNQYKTILGAMNSEGNIINSFSLSSKDLIPRMDYSYHFKLRNSEINEFLKQNSKIKPLDDFIDFCQTGNTTYGPKRKFVQKGIRYIHTTNLSMIGIDFTKEIKHIKPRSEMDFKSAYTKLHDVLIARVGKGCVGKSAIIDSKDNMGIVSDCLYIIRTKNISPYYITIFFKTRYGREWIDLNTHGLSTSCINKWELFSTPIPILSKQQQKIIENKFKNLLKNSIRNGNNKDLLADLELIIDYAESKIIKIIDIEEK